jgi:integrase
MATITDPKKVGELLRAIDGYQGDITTRCALKLAPYVMLRPNEIRYAEWSEINFNEKQWSIPADKMKMGKPHIIPLSNQVIEILKTIQPITGEGKYVFPSLWYSKDKPMSENTINAALRRLGYTKDEIVSHGFRGMASTLLYESNKFKSEVIEMQLAHAERNKVKAAYNRAEYIEERKDMMQWYADYLDSLKNG